MDQYEELKELSTAVYEFSNAVKHIQALAHKLLHNDNELDVEITLREAIPYAQKDLFDKRNADIGIELTDVAETIHQMNDHCSSYKQKNKLIGLKQDKMPREVALIMLDSVNKWYNIRLIECKRDLKALIVKMNQSKDVLID